MTPNPLQLIRYPRTALSIKTDQNGTSFPTKSNDVEKGAFEKQASNTSESPAAANQVDQSCLTASFPTMVLIGLVMVSIVLGRQYIKDILIYIDSLDLWQSTFLFAIMFTLVAFPIMWGYVLLNIATGYTYGFLGGTVMTAGCCLYAITCAHLILGRFFKGYVQKTYVVNEQTRALMKVVSGRNGYKIVFLTRLTPIPFGLQNAIFAVSGIRLLPYVAASSSGLLVTQFVYAYIGSTLRSLAEVFSDENTITAWIILTVQMVITACLTWFIIHLAKRELEKKVLEDGQAEPVATSSLTESRGIQTSESRPRSHSRNQSVNIPPITGPMVHA